MDTIAINAGVKEGEGKKNKRKLGEKASASIATGVAGAGVGIAAKAIIDKLQDHPVETDDDELSTVTDHHNTNSDVEEVIPFVDPDDVMLEEPMEEVQAEVTTEYQIDDNPYEPFANDDYTDDSLSQEENTLIAVYDEPDVIVEEDSVVDLICGIPEEQYPSATVDPIYPEENLYADTDTGFNDMDIQSDLMA